MVTAGELIKPGNVGVGPAWWPVALSLDVQAKPIAVQIGNARLAVFRDRAGSVHVLEDRCPHRRLPLSMGQVTDDGVLQCGYHGWCFDGTTGRCTKIPGYRPQERVPPRFAATVYPTIEELGMVLAWVGDDRAPGPPVIGGKSRRPDVSATETYPAPHQDLVDAILEDPVITLGLAKRRGVGLPAVGGFDGFQAALSMIQRDGAAGFVLGEGSVVVEHPVRRTRGSASGEELMLRCEVWGTTGLTELRLRAPGGAEVWQAVIALTPNDRGQTVVRWWTAVPTRESTGVQLVKRIEARLGWAAIRLPRVLNPVRAAPKITAAWQSLAATTPARDSDSSPTPDGGKP